MGSWKWTENNDELLWSEGLYKIFDKNIDESVSWDAFLENVLPEDIRLVENCLDQVKTKKSGSSIDYRIFKHGAVRYLSLTVKPHSILNMVVLGAVLDITERKVQEMQLEQFNLRQSKIIKELDESERKYRLLFERSIDPIFLATNDLVLLDGNDSFLKFSGYSLSKTEPIINLFANRDDYDYFRSAIEENKEILDFEVSLITRSGGKKFCLLNCVFIPDQALGFFCYLGIIHDLTQRKQAENDMLNAERLSLTGKIARTIAHEVRNPLTNLNLALDQLREEMPAKNESAKLFGDIIQRNANRIEQLIEEMLNSSKPKVLHLLLTPIKEILEGTIQMAIDRINLKQIKLLTSYQDDLPRLLVDKANMQIALLNIIINAVEAMVPFEGVLKIDVSVREKILTLSISDNGKGIPAEEIDKLFDPFFTNKDRGKGLGLTSTKNILNSHNAQIEVKSELNKGTTFYIRFKLAG